MTATPLDQLSEQFGIGRAYHDYRGELKAFSTATRLALLTAMGVDASGSATPSDDAKHHHGAPAAGLPRALIVQQGQPVVIKVSPADLQGATSMAWTLETETGATESGTLDLAVLRPPSLQVDDQPLSCLVPFSSEPAAGYHRMTVRIGSGAAFPLSLIVTPDRCYEPESLQHEKRLWGITLQLYTLRSPGNWGLGDFGDLTEVIQLAAPLGCGLIGLNPLHALFPADPDHISPYSPSSRRFLNPLYISLPRIPEARECVRLQRFLESEGAEQLDRLRASSNVDYPRVAALKFHWLWILHGEFRRNHLSADTERARSFRRFVEQGGSALHLHAVFDALHLHLKNSTAGIGGWPSWPAAYRDPASTEVARFAAEHEVEVEFHLYAQWLVAEQLAAAQDLARRLGMAVGLYGDVAVGVSAGGSETWSNPRLYVTGAAIGAPPDPLALKGQDWGIPPQSPFELAQQGFEPFIAMLRLNMRSVGALRLDHVMALFRQWWVPRGFIATDGAYVHYPLADLMRLLCLESHRNQCIVIGEDLGTVPDAVRDAMQKHAVAHYKVLLFEKAQDGTFKSPAAYERCALAAVTTHDLPPFRGWWESVDIEIADRLDLYPDAAARARVVESREADRRHLMSALVGAGLWYWQPHEALPVYSHALMRATHLYLALSNAELAVVQLEDLAGMIDPVNVPGTYLEHPNWQRKMSKPAASIFGGEEIREMLGAMSIARTGRNPN
ncbi:MAG: 4-alpha-glucanotransferase [Steroidobacteraceae bacterium]